MITKIILPKLGETMEEGVITKWLRKEGDKVAKGDPIFEVMTDKANFEAEAPAGGILRKILAQPGETPVRITTVIGYIADSMDEQVPQGESGGAPARPEEKKSPRETAEAPMKTAAAAGEGVRATPLAKKIAKEKGIDLSRVTGTGPGGRIVEKDVLGFSGPGGAAKTAAVPGEDEVIPLKGIRETIARRLAQSMHDAPHYYLQTEIDVTDAIRFRESRRKEFSFNDLLIRACAVALREYRLVNSTLENNNIIKHGRINIGMAVAADDKLIVPVIKDADKKTAQEVSQASKMLIEKVKAGKVSIEDLSGGTFTISNLGMFDIDVFTAIINPPQVAILAVGKIKEGLVVENGKMQVRELMRVSLSCDHRVVDGAYGAKFLKKFKEALMEPKNII